MLNQIQARSFGPFKEGERMEQLTIFDETEEYQPRFKAFLKATGKTHVSEVKFFEFRMWISKHFKDFRKIHGLCPYEPMSREQHDRFTEYLFEVADRS